ncbi:MAG TPA: hypothetical protein VF188_18145 [Longimicrobiales bacterium]
MSARRSGYAILELLTALALTAVICGAMAGTLVAARRMVRSQARRVTFAEAVRAASAVLTGDLRYIAPVADVYAWSADSIALRVFRGTAVVCGAADDDAVFVRYQGLRDPDPAKDSLVVVRVGGDGPPLKLEASAATPAHCAGEDGEQAFRWTLEAPPPPGTMLLLFESGTYRLSEHALRYGHGHAGRQPLTAEAFDGDGSGFRLPGGPGAPIPAAPPAIELRLVARAEDIDREVPAPATGARLRFTLLNADRADAGRTR